MERWNLNDRIHVVELFIETKSIVATQRALRRGAHRRAVPDSHTIRRWIAKWRRDGSVRDSTSPGRPRTVRTEEHIEHVQASMERSPQTSLRRRKQTLRMTLGSVHRILHLDLHARAYKMQVVNALKPDDKVSRVQFCDTFLGMWRRDPAIVDNLLMTDEAHFLLSGSVNKQNCRFWGTENPRKLHQKALHSPKLTVWCGISTFGIIGPFFFRDDTGATCTVTAERYVTMLRNFLTPALQNHPHPLLWFQQDGATAHTARMSLAELRAMFPGHLISRFGDVPWPARSPDLTAPDFFLWGYLKSQVFENGPTTLQELEDNIHGAINAIPVGILQNTLRRSFLDRLHQCIENDGAHLRDIIFKT